MLDLINFISSSWRFPRQRDFARMGMGIKSRSIRSKRYWATHLRYSKAFLRSYLPGAKSITILGAGRLLDVDTAWLMDRFAEVHLVDYDPGCQSVWKRLRSQAPPGCTITTHLVDVTGVLERWTELLERGLRARGTIDALNSLLATLPSALVKEHSIPSADVLVSLNLLSQIPLYWRDRVIKLASHAGISEEQVWSSAEKGLERSMDQLQIAHIELLRTLRADRTAILTDTEFYYYDPAISPWQIEQAVGTQALEAMLRFEGGSPAAYDCWLWHIAPAGIEDSEYGEIHRVEARVFERV